MTHTFCGVYVQSINSQDTAQNPVPVLTSAITAADTVINCADAGMYEPSGHLRIQDEIVRYTSTTATTFLGCSRGQEGTTAAAHAPGAQVDWFAHPEQQVRTVFAHEAGHVMHLEHRPYWLEPGGWRNVMCEGINPGSTLGNGMWDVFRDPSRNEDALVGEFALHQ